MTVSSGQEADKIAQILLEERIVACVQQLPIKSSYRWQGKIENSSEILLIMKSQKKLYDRVEEFIRANHSYQIPEIVMIPIVSGLPDYLDWIRKETV
jgi:periplasmic divalent cation tolerance protein